MLLSLLLEITVDFDNFFFKFFFVCNVVLGFTTYEVGHVSPNRLQLTLKDIGRISFSRDLPVEDVRFVKFLRNVCLVVKNFLSAKKNFYSTR